MTTAIQKVNGTPVASHAEPRFDPLALAEAEAIRARTEAEAEARRIAAEAEGEAVRIKAAEEAEKQRIANERARMRLEKEQADHAARIAEANRKREETERETAKAREKAEAEAQEQAATDAKRQQSADSWRKAALGFAIVCAVVALPVQMAAFYNPDAKWLLVAPFMLEGGAWVVLRGAAAAVDDHRPHWHYRLIAWALAFVAAGVNLAHGLYAFDPATAIGTAFASLAGPGVWDLHEHGRIRVRDGKLTRAERKTQRKAEKRAAAEKTAAEAKARAEKQAATKAAKEAAEKLATERAERYPEEWAHAVKVASAVGETTVTEAVWRRAWDELHAAEPGVTVDIIRTRNVAARRMLNARAETPEKGAAKAPSPQRASQMPKAKKQRAYNPPARRGVRTKGDTAPYTAAARKQASITAKQAANNGR